MSDKSYAYCCGDDSNCAGSGCQCHALTRQRDKLAEALRHIRDSTYRSAVTLRGLAGDALARIEEGKR